MPTEIDPIQSDYAHVIHPLHHPSAHQDPKVWVEGRGAMIKDIHGQRALIAYSC